MSTFLTKWANVEPDRPTSKPPLPAALAALQVDSSGWTMETMPDARAMSQGAAEREPDPPGVPWADWKAAALNRLFREQGVTGKPGRITATTVRHGERRAGSNG